MWSAANTILREKFWALNTYDRKRKILLKIKAFSFIP